MMPLNPFFARMFPYFMIAFMIVLFVISFFIFSYLLIITIFIGFVLFVIGFIRVKFFNRGKNKTFYEEIFIIQRHAQNAHDSDQKETDQPVQSGYRESTGRIIEHDGRHGENEKK